MWLLTKADMRASTSEHSKFPVLHQPLVHARPKVGLALQRYSTRCELSTSLTFCTTRCARYLGSREVKEVTPALPMSKVIRGDISVCNILLGCIADAACNVIQNLQWTMNAVPSASSSHVTCQHHEQSRLWCSNNNEHCASVEMLPA